MPLLHTISSSTHRHSTLFFFVFVFDIEERIALPVQIFFKDVNNWTVHEFRAFSYQQYVNFCFVLQNR